MLCVSLCICSYGAASETLGGSTASLNSFVFVSVVNAVSTYLFVFLLFVFVVAVFLCFRF